MASPLVPLHPGYFVCRVRPAAFRVPSRRFPVAPLEENTLDRIDLTIDG